MIIYSFQYQDELIEGDNFEDLVAYIELNYPAGNYDIYKTDEDGVKEYYASLTVRKP